MRQKRQKQEEQKAAADNSHVPKLKEPDRSGKRMWAAFLRAGAKSGRVGAMSATIPYRGRLAPTPSGPLHIGHARTFFAAYKRSRQAGGALVLRIEDLYADHCRMDYADGIREDLRWLGIRWDEGPDEGGAFGPYLQSLRRESHYLPAWRSLMEKGLLYPSRHTRREVERAMTAPHEGDAEPVFPESLRPASFERHAEPGGEVNWRLKVEYGRRVRFTDGCAGPREFVAGRDFGDFVVWCKNGWPSYEMAVVADDAAMRISEVVRGEDLLLSTARQILLYEALELPLPAFYHCKLVRDEQGVRLAKRSDAVSIATLRERGLSPEEVLSLAEKGV